MSDFVKEYIKHKYSKPGEVFLGTAAKFVHDVADLHVSLCHDILDEGDAGGLKMAVNRERAGCGGCGDRSRFRTSNSHLEQERMPLGRRRFSPCVQHLLLGSSVLLDPGNFQRFGDGLVFSGP